MWDLHCHILPGLDDGAKDLGQALDMARHAAADGIQGMGCTPHWMAGVYANDRETVLQSISELGSHLEREGIDLELYPGAELRLDPAIPKGLAGGELLTVADRGRYVLIEPPPDTLPEAFESFLWELWSAGYIPILAHPERHPMIAADLKRLVDWVRMGVVIQITAASLLGGFGATAERVTRRLIQHNLVHIVASDAHSSINRRPILSRARDRICQIAGQETADTLTTHWPRAILHDQDFHRPAPELLEPPKPKPSMWKRLLSSVCP